MKLGPSKLKISYYLQCIIRAPQSPELSGCCFLEYTSHFRSTSRAQQQSTNLHYMHFQIFLKHFLKLPWAVCQNTQYVKKTSQHTI